MDTKELKNLLINKIAELSKDASPSDIESLSKSYETIRKAEAPDPYKSMARVFSSAMSFGSSAIKKGDKDDIGRKNETV